MSSRRKGLGRKRRAWAGKAGWRRARGRYRCPHLSLACPARLGTCEGRARRQCDPAGESRALAHVGMSHDGIQKSIEIPIAVKLGLAVRSGKMSGTVLGSSG